MKIRHEEESGSPHVNLTPMIDVVFLLVIFFMVTTTFIQLEKEMDIDLPEASAADPVSSRMREIVLNVRKDGTVAVDGSVLPFEDLEELLAAAASRDPDQEVIIRGDREAMLEKVVRVLDVCRTASILNLSIATLEPQ